MQAKLSQLDKSLDNILNELGMSFYTHNLDYYLLDNSKLKINQESKEYNSYTYKGKKFKKGNNFFQQVSNHYRPNIRIEKEARNIFISLFKNANEIEQSFLLKHYEYFITFDQAFNYLNKIDDSKNKALHFVTHHSLKGIMRKVDKEEKLLIKIYNLEPENFYENLLSYLSNHAQIYLDSIYSHSYQGMLKNLINDYLPEKRKSFAVFTGDNQKKYLENSSILYENDQIECEIVVKFNKTFIEENYVPDSLKEKHEITQQQGKIISGIEELLKESKRLDITSIHKVLTQDHEILTFYITKEKNDITKQNIVDFIQICLSYWKDNVHELKNLKDSDMLKEISRNAEIVFLHNSLLDKLETKNNHYKEKKVKI